MQAPDALSRALSQIGLVETDAEGDERQTALAPGQALVSRAGAVWRWDGYTIRAGTPTEAAVRLQQRNRLAALRTRLAEVEAEVRRHFGDLVFTQTVPRSVRLAEAPSHGLPAIAYDPRSSGAEAYWKVAMELVERS